MSLRARLRLDDDGLPALVLTRKKKVCVADESGDEDVTDKLTMSRLDQARVVL